jgi:transposase
LGSLICYEDDAKMIRKIQAIILLEEKASIATIEGLSGYKREVAVKFRRKYVKGGLEALRSKRKKKAAKSLLTHNQREEIVTILNEQKPSEFGYSQPFWTTTILANLIKEQWGVEYKSKSSLYLLFRKAKFTFRKPEKCSERRDEKVIAAWKEKYKPIIQEECARTDSVLLTGDEAVLTATTRVQRAWLPRDRPAFVEDAAKRKIIFLEIGSGCAHPFKTLEQTGTATIMILR